MTDIKTPSGKRKFIRDLIGSVQRDIIAAVRKMPDDWDGHELRQLIADKFEQETTDMPRSRAKDYANTRLVNNL